MKTKTAFLLLLINTLCFGQEPSTTRSKQQNFEKKLFIELNSRASFYEVNDRYELLKDTIYHANSGFKVYPEYDIALIGNVEYVILRYPVYKKGIQSGRAMDYEQANKDNSQGAIRAEIAKKNGKMLAIKKTDFDLIDKEEYFSTSFRNPKNYYISKILNSFKNLRMLVTLL